MYLEIALFCMAIVATVLATLLYSERRHRRKKNFETSFNPSGQLSAKLAMTQDSSIPFSAGISKAAPFGVKINDSNDRQVLQISLPDAAFFNTQTWKKIELTTTSSWIQPLVADAMAALPLPFLASLQSSRTFHVVFDGAGHLMRTKDHTGFRSILVDKTGTILSHGKLVPSGHLLLNATAAWELAAIVTQRKFLVDIDRKLLALKSGVAEIESLLKNERIGRLQANTRSIAETILLVRNNPSFLYQQAASQQMIENIEREASGDVRAYLLDLQALIERLKQVSLTGLWSADTDPLSREVESATGILRAAAFALSVRCFAAGLLPHYAEDQHRLTSRLTDIKDLWHKLNARSKDVQRLAFGKLNAMSEVMSLQSTLDAKRKEAKGRITQRFEESARMLRSVLNDSLLLSEEQNIFEVAAKPIHLKIEVDRSGRLTASHVAAA